MIQHQLAVFSKSVYSLQAFTEGTLLFVHPLLGWWLKLELRRAAGAPRHSCINSSFIKTFDKSFDKSDPEWPDSSCAQVWLWQVNAWGARPGPFSENHVVTCRPDSSRCLARHRLSTASQINRIQKVCNFRRESALRRVVASLAIKKVGDRAFLWTLTSTM